MSGTTFTHIFLYLDFFIIGALTTVAVRHAYAHFRPLKHEPKDPNPSTPNDLIPTAVKERLLQAAQNHYQTALSHSADQLQRNLESTTEQINNLIKRLAVEIVSSELERYRTELNQLHGQAVIDLSGIKKEMAGHQAELKAKLAQEMEVEKQQLIKQIDTKLGDAVGSFLLETLQHNIDLGSQSSYLIAMLEEHKADFVKEVTDEVQSDR
jgi:hypothetical protein